ncbi:hypothetical protein [Streptomyces canus]|uniref:hypothetical protein n=1 Tax=Streptomyces canus TaxID=58343 RepID=UPI0034418DFB
MLAIYRCISDLSAARRTKAGAMRRKPPGLREYLDVPMHLWLAIVRALLGALAAGLFGMTHQISGIFVAVTLGFSAPTILGQLGTFPQVAAAVTGDRTKETTPSGANVVLPDRGQVEGAVQ